MLYCEVKQGILTQHDSPVFPLPLEKRRQMEEAEEANKAKQIRANQIKIRGKAMQSKPKQSKIKGKQSQAKAKQKRSNKERKAKQSKASQVKSNQIKSNQIKSNQIYSIAKARQRQRASEPPLTAATLSLNSDASPRTVILPRLKIAPPSPTPSSWKGTKKIRDWRVTSTPLDEGKKWLQSCRDI